jgi:hypothetical protein
VSHVHICRGVLVGVPTVEFLECPTCDAVTPMTCRYYEWYGPSMTCLGCGERWHDGEMEERPFARGWRKRRIQEALRKLRECVVRP